MSASRFILVGAVTVDKSLNLEYHFLSTTDHLNTNLAAFWAEQRLYSNGTETYLEDMWWPASIWKACLSKSKVSQLLCDYS